MKQIISNNERIITFGFSSCLNLVLKTKALSICHQNPFVSPLSMLPPFAHPQNFLYIVGYKDYLCLHGFTMHQQYPALYFPTNAHNVKKC